MLIIDGFLDSFDSLREYADSASFGTIRNDADGVDYPEICADIPDHVKAEIFSRLESIKGAPVDNPVLFMRRSPAGIHCPHQVHSDKTMGKYSLMLYMNRIEDCQGGTSFLSHKATGIGYNPEWQEFVSIITADQNNSDAWDVRELASMQPNRAVIFDAARLHRAEPVGGFGETPQDMRLVLTCFFS